MSLKKKRPSVAFSWHRSFAILAPWRKGKGDAVLESEVVLTKMKILSNFEQQTNVEDSISNVSLSMFEQGGIESAKAAEGGSIKSTSTGKQRKEDYLSSIFLDSELPRLYKFESEDSGVEMPSGANSPSTPTGSEQSFVVHSRESSCDSGALSSPLPSQDPLLLLDTECTDLLAISELEDLEETMQTTVMETDLTETDGVTHREDSMCQFEKKRPDIDMERSDDGSLQNPLEENESKSEKQMKMRLKVLETDTMEEDTCARTDSSIQAYDDSTSGVEFQGAPLRKSTTSDSLDEYMEECCRLSEQVNQARTSPLGSGLGYLEHICQLIEKIGQLQEHNLKLQKQICGLQKDGRVIKTKEDFFIQHCHCGAAGLAFQELKRHSRSDFPSGTLSDLTTIPEVTHNPLRGARRDGEPLFQPTIPLWRRGLNRRSYTEGEARYLGDSAEVLSAPHRRLSDNYTWGKVKELVKKTKLRNHSRLGLSSSSLKHSCPQLYRPDLGSLDLPRRDRNSMIALGHQSKTDFLWAQ